MAPRFYPLARGFTVFSGWGPRDGAFHAGLDFGREGGSGGLPVFAAQGGTVVYSGAASGFGQWVVVDHPTEDGSGTTVYGHVLPEVGVGQRVEAGQRIARINPVQGPGNGNVPPHCHFEVHNTVWSAVISGRQDPAPWLAGAAYPGEAPTPSPTGGTVTEIQWGVDTASYQQGMDLQRTAAEGFVAVLHKATEGTGYRNPAYPEQRDRARAAGLTFVAYHYVGDSSDGGVGGWYDAEAEADNFAGYVNDTNVRAMLDIEKGCQSAQHALDVKVALERRGYRVVINYLPQWYWRDHLGRPDISGLNPIMASSYPGGTGYASQIYAANDQDWSDYGGGRTAILQFTDRATVAGRQVDAWAYRGTRAQLDSLLTGAAPAAPAPPEVPDVTPEQQAQLDRIEQMSSWTLDQFCGPGTADAWRNNKPANGWPQFLGQNDDGSGRTVVEGLRALGAAVGKVGSGATGVDAAGIARQVSAAVSAGLSAVKVQLTAKGGDQ